jgi:HEPN domain-containing protein
VEKIFKAIVEEYQLSFLKTHKLEILYESIKNCLNFEADLDQIKRLDEVYISARYPAELGLLPQGKPSTDDAASFSKFAKQLFHRVSQDLSSMTK